MFMVSAFAMDDRSQLRCSHIQGAVLSLDALRASSDNTGKKRLRTP